MAENTKPELMKKIPLPIYGQNAPEQWARVDKIIRELRAGFFYTAAPLMDNMLTDDRIKGVLSVRVNSVINKERIIIPANKSKRAKKIAKDIEENFDKIIPPSQLKEIMETGIMQGAGFGTIDWVRISGPDAKWCPKLRVWHNQHLRYQWYNTDRPDLPPTVQNIAYQPDYSEELDTGWQGKIGTYRTITSTGEEVIEPNTGAWFLYTPYGYNYSYLRGAMCALASTWLLRRMSRFQWARHTEVMGTPVWKLHMPYVENELVDKKFLQEVSAIGFQGKVRLPMLDNGTQYDISLLESGSQAYNGFDLIIQQCNREIAVLLLGQSASTENQKAFIQQAHAGEDIRLEVMKHDALIANDIREQILEWYVEYNYGKNNRELTPTIRYLVEPEEDTKIKAETVQLLSTAVKTFVECGVQIDYNQFLNQFKIPLLIDSDEPVKVIKEKDQEKDSQDNKDDADSNTEKLAMIDGETSNVPTLIFLRHGSTKLNSDVDGEKLRGWLNPPLDKEGKAEAKKIAEQLKDTKLKSIYYSTLKRTEQTAKIVAKDHPDAEMIPSDNLKPMDFGELAGKPIKDILGQMLYYVANENETPPGASETFKQFQLRVLSYLQTLMEDAIEDPSGACLVVTHSRDIRLLVGWLMVDPDADQVEEIDKLPLFSKTDVVQPGDCLTIQYVNGEWCMI